MKFAHSTLIRRKVKLYNRFRKTSSTPFSNPLKNQNSETHRWNFADLQKFIWFEKLRVNPRQRQELQLIFHKIISDYLEQKKLANSELWRHEICTRLPEWLYIPKEFLGQRKNLQELFPFQSSGALKCEGFMMTAIDQLFCQSITCSSSFSIIKHWRKMGKMTGEKYCWLFRSIH